MITKSQIVEILEKEIANEVWYQDEGCEQRLEKCLTKAEEKLLSLISQDRAELTKKIEALRKSWTTCKKKNCKECEEANHYIETIWNPTFHQIIQLIQNKKLQ